MSTVLQTNREPPPLAIDTVLSWLESLGCDLGALTCIESGGRPCLKARRDVARGDVLMFIPDAALLSVDAAKASRIGRVIAGAATDDISGYGYITAFILDTLRRPQLWMPYLRTLRADFSAHPLFFAEAESGAMLRSFASVVNGRSRLQLMRDFVRVNAALSGQGRFDLDDFKWAWCCVFTRVGPTGDAHTPWSDSSHGFLFRATTDIAAGDLLTDSGGTFSNSPIVGSWGSRLDVRQQMPVIAEAKN